MPEPKSGAATPSTADAAGTTEPAPAKAVDAPEPDVEAIFLRPLAPTRDPAAASPDASLIDTITRIVTEMLATHVRDSVTAAVRALAPRLVVSLPDDVQLAAGDVGDTQVRQRPRRQPRAGPTELPGSKADSDPE